MTPVELQAHVRAAVEVLPILPEKRGDIEPAVSQIGAAYIFGGVAGAARFRDGGTQKAERDLAELHKTLIKAVAQIHELKSEAHAALDAEIVAAAIVRAANESQGKYHRRDRVLPTLIIDDTMLAYAIAVENARQKLVAAPKTKVGAPTKELAAAVAEVAAHVFENLTGLSPTITVRWDKDDIPAGGEFVGFLKSLFGAMDINASAVGMARAVREKR